MRQFFNFQLNWFEIVYLAIALATFQHTTWSAATVFEGPEPPITSLEHTHWVINGALIAIAVDIGMLVTARELRLGQGKTRGWKIVMISAFIASAIATFYTQILFSIFHTREFDLGDGVSSYWRASLDPIIQARVILVPLMLPLFAVIFTAASIVHQQEVIIQQKIEKIQRKDLKLFKFTGVNKTWAFETEKERDDFQQNYEKKRQKRLEKRNRRRNGMEIEISGSDIRQIRGPKPKLPVIVGESDGQNIKN